jgi:ATP-dependent protease ClpP protease subunit
MLDIRSVLKAQGLLAGNELLANLIVARRRETEKSITAKPWYRIDNANPDEAELWLFDEISWWGISAASFIEELRAITAPKIVVHINSPGGDVFDGIAIMSLLRAHPAYVTTRDESLAASIASVIMQGGDHRVMVQHSTMMIHEASGMFWGNADEMRAFADLLEKVSDNIAGIYAERSGDDKGDREAFRAAMRAETWLSDTEAVELGLADEVEIPVPANPAAKSNAVAVNDAAVVVDAGGIVHTLTLNGVPLTFAAANTAVATPAPTKPEPTEAERDRIRVQWQQSLINTEADRLEDLLQ